MIDRLPVPAEDLVTWEFQVEQQGFITRYGSGGGFFYKQVILQSGAAPDTYPVKRISPEVHKIALSISSSLE